MNCNDQEPISLLFGMVMIILMASGFAMHGFMVSGQTLHDNSDATIFIDLESNFKLWNQDEKMLNPDFNITLVYYNIDNNHSCYYEIIIDDTISNGMMNFSQFHNYSIIDRQNIGLMEIRINNETIFNARNIILVDGINADTISSASKPFTINLKPSEWTEKEWNIFWSLVVSSLFALAISYLSVRHYRKKHGMVEIK